MENRAKLEFSYTDQFGNKTVLVKEFDQVLIEEVDEVFGYTIDRFKDFLIACEYTNELVNTIDYERD